MSDIELVIKIPKELYNYMQTDEYDKHLDKRFDYQIRFALKNGTPLPKGHGRLNGADIIKDFKNKVKHYGKDYRFTQEEILNILERYEIKYEPIIIEADKAESEENNG